MYRPVSREPVLVTDTSIQPPQVLRALEVVTVRERQVARIDVKLTGRPYPNVEWFKDNQVLTDSAKYKILWNAEGVHSLLINHVENSDQGTYVCLAKNPGGEAKLIVTLSVQANIQVTAPQFVEKFQSVVITPGESITLRCKVSGNPTPKLQWMKDQTALTNGSPYKIEEKEGESTVFISSAKLDDSGWFQCTAVNNGGSATLRGRILVQERQVLTVIQNNDVSSTHRTTHTHHQVVNLHQGQHFLRRDEDVSTVTPKFESQPQDLGSLREGASAHFECRLVPTDDPNLKIVWLHNGRPLKASSRVRTMFDFGYATLDISSLNVEDSGTYTILAVNSLGETRASASITVVGSRTLLTSSQHPESMDQITYLETQKKTTVRQETDEYAARERPAFRQIRSVETIEGRPAHFEAKLAPVNDNTIKVEWYFNGQPLQIGSRFRILNDFGFVALDILHTIPEDSGTYTCIATNALGRQETSARLHCYGKNTVTGEATWTQDMDDSTVRDMSSQMPAFVTQMQNVEIKEGQRAYFEARYVPQGDHTLKIEWFKDGRPLNMASRIAMQSDFGFAALTINSCNSEDSGQYACIATNRTGQAQTVATLFCESKDGLILNTQHASALNQIAHLEGQQIHMGPVPTDRPEEFVSMEAPRFAKAMADLGEVNEGQSIHFECRLLPMNDPKMTVEWFHNGSPLQFGHRFRPMYDFGYVALDILYAYPEDSGTYTVVAKNQLGTVQCESHVVVID